MSTLAIEGLNFGILDQISVSRAKLTLVWWFGDENCDNLSLTLNLRNEEKDFKNILAIGNMIVSWLDYLFLIRACQMFFL